MPVWSVPGGSCGGDDWRWALLSSASAGPVAGRTRRPGRRPGPGPVEVDSDAAGFPTGFLPVDPRDHNPAMIPAVVVARV